MMKKAILIASIGALILTLSACGEKCTVPNCDNKLYQDGYCEYHYSVICKADGCDDEVYKDGYCKYHYTVNSVDDTAKDIFDGLFG